MKRYTEKIRAALPGTRLELKEHTYAAVEGLRAICGIVDGEERLIVDGCKAFRFTGETAGGRSGVKICPMNHENRLALNREFSYTVPQAVGGELASFGFGDRLGIAGESHLSAVEGTGVKPVLAQQSLRELTLTGRTYEEVLDAAAWAVFKKGYKDGYGADGDHLKTREEVAAALDHGMSMITLDCSLVLGAAPSGVEERRQRYEALPGEYREGLEGSYLPDSEAMGLGICFDRELLEETALIYGPAVELAEEVYRLIRKTGRRVDLEISLDETAHTTKPAEHYFVACELYKKQVRVTGVAPRFVGEFQKAVDYIGDPEAFRRDLKAHCRVADYFGHKISLHSGSDKFRVFAALSEETGGRFHVKTSGTSWLEAVRVIAQTDPELYRRMHRTALEHFAEARRYYEVHCDPEKIRPLEEMPDERLPDYMDQEDARQLLHIAYGFMLREGDGLRERILEALGKQKGAYQAALERHFAKHLDMLGYGKRGSEDRTVPMEKKQSI